MSRRVRLVGILVLLTVSLPALADKASDAYKRGQNAEVRQNYELAYQAYKEAYDLRPGNMTYRSAFTRMRFYASTTLVHQGQILRDQGKLQEALAAFQKAAAMDPANDLAAQEVRRTQADIDASHNAPSSSAPPPNQGMAKMTQEAQGPVELKAIANQPINMRMTEDAKNVYTTIGKLAGINVLFDPDYVSRRISVELNSVTLNQALEIVALESKTFWRPVTSNTVFVAADTPAKRKELEQNVLKTFYLTNVSGPNDLQDTVNAIRQMLDLTRLIQVQSQNAIVARGTPDQIALAEKIINDLDKSKSEVVVEVAVMQVQKEKIRNIGLNPPTSASVQLQSNVSTTSSSNNNNNNGTGTTTGTSTTNSTTGSLTLNQLSNLNSNNFVVTIPAASFQFLASDTSSKVLENPEIRAVDNQKATLKIGSRVPVATGSFQPGIGGVGINPLVNTQFQYLDVGVQIEITPRIHLGREVTLKMVLEISSVTGQSNIGGISQPIIGQRRIEHEIRLKDGEVNVLGGILEDSDVRSLTGYPWISKVPILKYLFAQSNKDITNNEIVFALIPHIVRSPDLTEQNLRALDVGTANAIEIHRESSGGTPGPTSRLRQPAPAGQNALATGGTAAAAANAAPPNASASLATPGAATTNTQPAMTASLSSGQGVLSFEPATINQPVGSTFMVNISLNGAPNVHTVPVQLQYDPKNLQLLNVSDGGTLSRDGQSVAIVHREDTNTGSMQVTATRPPGSGGIASQGPVFTLTFLAKAPGQSTLSITQGSARDPNGQATPVAGAQAMVSVK